MCFSCKEVGGGRGRGFVAGGGVWGEEGGHNRFSFTRKKEEWILLQWKQLSL